MELNGKKVDRASLEIGGVDPRDYPDFCDAFVFGATFEDGTPLTEDEMDQFNDKYPEVVWDMAYQSLH